MRLRFILPACVVIVFAACLPLAMGGPVNVLVVRNGNSPVSCRIAAYYMTMRSIAPGFLVTITTPDSSLSSENEAIPPDDYLAKIEQPIRDFLKSHKLTDKIQYIVLTKGIPIRLATDPFGGTWGGESVDSMLAAMDLVKPMRIGIPAGEGKTGGYPLINRYWRSAEPFSHAKYGGYLVTRLDGYTEADAKALVDRALAAPPAKALILLDAASASSPEAIARQPRSILGSDGLPDRTYDMPYGDFNAEMARAAEVIKGRPNIEVRLEQTSEFVSSSEPLAGYVSWGSNDKHYQEKTYHELKFVARSIVETAVSTSGRTFLPTKGGQSLVADLIAQGAAGAKGYVTEPLLHSMASPTVLFDLYTSGRNLAESYYAASRFVGWKDVVIGDPLCTLFGDGESH